MLLAVVQRKTQEAKMRQVLSAMQAKNTERMLEEIQGKKIRVKCVTKECDSSKGVKKKGVEKEMQQVNSMWI